MVASYLDLHLEIDSDGRLRTKLYDKEDDFIFSIGIVNFISSFLFLYVATFKLHQNMEYIYRSQCDI